MNWKNVNKLKSDGNKAFNVKSYDDSFNCRKEAIELVNSGYNTAASIIYSNICQTELTNKDYSSALEHANKSLELDPSFKKSILRRAMANCELKNYEEAMKDLRYLFEYDSTNSQVISLMRRCSDLPKMKQKLRAAYVAYFLRRALQKGCQNYEAPLEYRLADGILKLSLLRQIFLSLKNSEFVSQLLSGACVTPNIFAVYLLLNNWFSVQIMKLNLPSIQRIMLTSHEFEIFFQVAQPSIFNLMFTMLPNESMFGPWSRYSNIYHVKENRDLFPTIDANDLRVIEQNARIMTRLPYLPQMVKFKNCNFPNLRELLFDSARSPNMEFLKLWQKKKWPVNTLILSNSEINLESFKRFDGVISYHLTTLYIDFAKNGTLITKEIYHILYKHLTAFKRVFPNLAEVNVTHNYSIDIKKFSSFIQTPLKQILEGCTAIDYKPEWCSNLQFLITIELGYPTVLDIKNTTLEMLKNAVDSYRHELNVRNIRFGGPSVSTFEYHSCCSSLFTLGFETDAAYFEINFSFIL